MSLSTARKTSLLILMTFVMIGLSGLIAKPANADVRINIGFGMPYTYYGPSYGVHYHHYHRPRHYRAPKHHHRHYHHPRSYRGPVVHHHHYQAPRSHHRGHHRGHQRPHRW
ncbi:MAG: hypothetical protein JJU48_01550 [Methylophaga sp.]|nr:hypothetical protein [Methylophaga sp.]